MSSKNILQEYAIVEGYSTPKYKTIRAGGQDHSPLWKSTVTVNGDHINIITSKVFNTKTAAETSAADLMLSNLKNISRKNYTTSVLTNITKLNTNITPKLNTNITNLTTLFLVDESFHHTSTISKYTSGSDIVVMTAGDRNKLDEISDRVVVLKINNFIIDSSLYIGSLLSQNRYQRYILISNNNVIKHSIVSIKNFRTTMNNNIEKIEVYSFATGNDAIAYYNSK